MILRTRILEHSDNIQRQSLIYQEINHPFRKNWKIKTQESLDITVNQQKLTKDSRRCLPSSTGSVLMMHSKPVQNRIIHISEPLTNTTTHMT